MLHYKNQLTLILLGVTMLLNVSCTKTEPLVITPTNNLGRYTIIAKPVDSLKNTLVIEGRVLNANTKQPIPSQEVLFAYLNLGDLNIDGDEDGRYRIELEEGYLSKYENEVSLKANVDFKKSIQTDILNLKNGMHYNIDFYLTTVTKLGFKCKTARSTYLE